MLASRSRRQVGTSLGIYSAGFRLADEVNGERLSPTAHRQVTCDWSILGTGTVLRFSPDALTPGLSWMPDSHLQSVRDVRTQESSGKAKTCAPPHPSVKDGGLQSSELGSAKHLADAVHDLRQPLQTLFLLSSLLARTVDGEAAQKLVARIDVSLTAMAATLGGLAMVPPTHHETIVPDNRPNSESAHALPQSIVAPGGLAETPAVSVIFVVDDDDDVRAALRSVLEDEGHEVRDFSSCEAFLACERRSGDGCLLVDAYLPGMSGLELLHQLHANGDAALPSIMITGQSDVPMAVDAMKAGAVDFIEKPVSREGLLTCIRRAVEQSRDQNARALWQQEAEHLVSGLTARQREIMDLVLAGVPSKNIAADLGISQRTVENHRAAIMTKTGAKSLPALARLAVTALSAGFSAPHSHFDPM